MAIRVYIPEHNVTGHIKTEMAYGAYITYYLGGLEYNVLMDSEDYVLLDDVFFDSEGDE